MIDPMHNLLLGTACHILSGWLELGIIKNKLLGDIQDKVNSFVTTNDMLVVFQLNIFRIFHIYNRPVEKLDANIFLVRP